MSPLTLRPKQNTNEQRNQQAQSQPMTLRPKQGKEQLPQQQEQVKPEPEEENIFLKSLKDIPKNLAGQIGLGLLQGQTAPLDLLKTFMMGEALTGLEEAQEASERMGVPFDMESEKQKIFQSLEAIPTQTLAEKLLEEHTGVSTAPQTGFQKGARTIAEFAGMTPKTEKAVPKALSVETKALKETAEEFGLKQFAGMETEKAPSVTPVVSPKKEKSLRTELSETTKKAVSDVIDQKIPIKKMREKGIDLKEAYTEAYEQASNTAKKMSKKEINVDPLIKFLVDEKSKIKASAPSLSSTDKTVLSEINTQLKQFSKSVKGSQAFGPEGEIINIPGKKIQKTATAEQLLDQYKNFNQEVEGIYRKTQFTGSENAVKKLYSEANDKIISSIEKVNPELANELKFANRVYHETSKLNQVEDILKKSFVDGYNPTKLTRTLGNRRERAFLERNLGKDSVKDLERIAKYGHEAEKRVFDQLKNPKTMKDYIENITPGQLAFLVGFKSHVGIALPISKALINRAQGLLFTREPTKHAFVSFLKEAAQLGKSPAPLFYASKKLEKAIKDEYGSEEEFLSDVKK